MGKMLSSKMKQVLTIEVSVALAASIKLPSPSVILRGRDFMDFQILSS